MTASSERSRHPRTGVRRPRRRYQSPRRRRGGVRLAKRLHSAAARPATVSGVFGGLNRLVLAAFVAGAVLVVVPPAAFADGCGSAPSAVNVYSECLGSGGGGKPTTGNATKGSITVAPAQTSAGSSGTPYIHISKRATKALKKAGKDEKSLSSLVKGYGAVRLLQSHSNPSMTPTAIGSAFDLGSGPTVLLIVLAGAAFLLLATTGVRVARHRHH
jgi:hypothetical protein